MRLVSPRQLDADTFDDSCPPDRIETRTAIDLTRLQFIRPAGLVRLACLAHHGTQRGDVIFTPPRQRDPAVYMSRAGLGDLLEQLGIDHGLPPVRRHQARRLLELQVYDPLGADGYDVADFIFDRLTASMPGPATEDEDVAVRLYDALYELVDNCNAHAHARQECRVAIAAQEFRSPNGRHVDFAIGDTGQGIRKSFSRSALYSPKSDRAAIELALTDRVSSVEDATGPGARRGVGLPRQVAQLASIGGHVRVRSGDAEVLCRQGGTVARTHSLEIKGTVVSGSIPC